MGGQGRDTVIHQGLVHASQKVGAQPSFRVKKTVVAWIRFLPKRDLCKKNSVFIPGFNIYFFH